MTRRSVLAPAVVLAVVAVSCLAGPFAAAGPADAAFRGKSGDLAFASNLSAGQGVDNPEGDYEIFTIAPNGTGLTQLTRNATDDTSPAWSPGGSEIAFEGFDGNDSEIFTLNVQGGTPTNITDNAKPDVNPAWSPDGARLAYVSDDYDDTSYPEGDIYTTSVDGGAPTKVTDDTETSIDRHPAWSPDGSRIAYSAECWGCEGFSRIMTVRPIGGTTPTPLIQDQPTKSGRRPEWSSNGRRIAYEGHGRDSGSRDVYVVDASGGTPVRLTNTSTLWEASPAWSPDNSRIAFSAWDGAVASGPSHAIYTMPASGGTPTNITEGLDIGDLEGLDWQPAPELPLPASKMACKKGGYKMFGFENRGRCIAFVNRMAHNR